MLLGCSQEQWEESVGEEVRAFEIDFQAIPPLIGITVGDWYPWRRGTRVVDQDVEGWGDGGDLRGRGAHGGYVAQVEDDGFDVGGGVLGQDILGDLVEFGLCSRCEDEGPGLFGGDVQGGRVPDAGGTDAGDDDYRLLA